MNLLEIQEYFSNNLVKFEDNVLINNLSKETTDILYQIGLPNHHTFGGDYEFFGNVELLDGKYLKLGTKNTFINEPFGLCIDIETQAIIGRTNYRTEGIRTYTINKNLKTYLEYIYTDIRFRDEVILPQILGQYYQNTEKYAKELKNRLMLIDKDDINTNFWHSSIGEMELGVI
ncbi:hypothetical protein ACFFLS_10070 [Flavobacterium procerum]|uniref:Uncharacterized protein n=1 Tax=Flavobacterium procerum TaxID=1455569 RepID=A0ABV6BPP2_9FLAO